MATLTSVPTAKAIGEEFPYPASSIKLDKHCPTNLQIKDLRKKLEKNVGSIICLIPEAYNFGYKFLICKEEAWTTFHTKRISKLTASDGGTRSASQKANRTIPPIPKLHNPMAFVIDDEWEEK